MPNFSYILLIILIFFIPMAFAGTEPWAFLILQTIIFIILSKLLIKKSSYALTKPAIIISSIFILLIAVSFIQILNYQSILGKGYFFPFSVCPVFTMQELMMFFVYFALFFIITQYFESSEQQNKILLFITISSLIVAVTGLSFPNGEYVRFFLDNDLNFAFGSFVNRNNAGSFLSVSFFITFAFLLPKFLGYKNFKHILFVLLWLLLIFSIIFTRSRGAMLGTFISLFVFLFLLTWFLSKNIKERIVKLFIICLLFFISSFWLYNNIDTINKFTNRHTGGFSEQARTSLYKAGFDILKDFPYTGVGIGAFSVSVNKYLDIELEQYPKRLHSDWLELLVGIGYPSGILFFILVLITVFLFLIKIKTLDISKKIKFIALLCAVLSMSVSCIIDFHLHIPANAVLFFITLALLSSSSFYKDEIKYYRFSTVIKIIFCLLFSVTIYFSIKDTMAWRATIFAKKLALENKIKNYEYAVNLSDNPRYAYALGLFYYDATKDNSFTNEQKKEYFQKVQVLATNNLKKYPFNKDFSYLYQLMNKN